MHKVAIVGRPNVGKSSLFNRLIGRREAVVADLPGVTRDAKEGLMLHQNHRITLIDTGGLWSGDEWEDAIREKAEWAMEGAQAVIFVLDPREGLSAADYEVTDWLRRLGKPVIIAANKIDSPKHEVYMAELWGLGFGEPIAISAEHARGLDDLLDRVMTYLPEDTEDVPDIAPIRISLIGRPNVGKSSLLNAITQTDRAIVADMPGTTRDSLDVEWDYGGQRFVLVDTAGIRKKPDTAVEDYAIQRSQAAIGRSDLIWLVVNAGDLGDHELKLANLAYDSGKPVIVIVNKWDLVPDADLKSTEKDLNQKLHHISYAPRVYTSAINEYGIHEMLAEAMKLHEKWQSRIPTSELNRWLGVWQMRQSVPNFHGKKLKMYFMTQVETAPPTFAIFCNRADFVTRAYEGFLQNRIREDLQLAGIPVRLKWNEKGPYKRGKNAENDD
ncbi:MULTISPECIES: ribosome biogenesis GTPase Der [unclassified Deinococcus]|jgi:GTP-binding protein|uniref:ribosome biogenesis GTPase Der n=1 Tax=unclassified Deinococcus TaxID=2623546 RepID=UPI0006DC6A25|nr:MULTISPECIES: ribosome biogenesis GTPase Der [unclassified Deinococcus]MCD0162361.1 ribosome biogenesis GTPase Der [Deinococcus sp. 6YEL10]MCD0177109.1 ribosome biogenesis GTPase Der [Deinococcus sp. 14RED07]OOV14486.1 ribosome biogenesis GTPase Der [Deinococcus sp. LM3]PIG98069.1 ribosome biogenesis GTPase Der [Deinococcus sp. UR1]